MLLQHLQDQLQTAQQAVVAANTQFADETGRNRDLQLELQRISDEMAQEKTAHTALAAKNSVLAENQAILQSKLDAALQIVALAALVGAFQGETKESKFRGYHLHRIHARLTLVKCIRIDMFVVCLFLLFLVIFFCC